MLIIKIVIYSFIFLSSSLIGILISKKYTNRVNELKEFKNALNIFKTKIKFTYAPLPEIFEEISKNTSENVSKLFKLTKEKMKNKTASISWIEAIDENNNNLKNEDKEKLKTLSKLLGTTDIEGQISQIEITETFLDEQIREATIEKQKNEKLYNQLGITVGLAIVIILV